MKALVTGCAGFIGFHLARALCDAGYEVHGVDNFARGNMDQELANMLSHANFTFHEGDLNNSSLLNNLDSDYTHIFHLAAINGTQNFYEAPYKVGVNSAIPTWMLLEKYKDSAVLRRFIFAGTPESYASSVEIGVAPIPTPEEVLLSINSPLERRWSYAAAKIFSESIISGAACEFGMKFTILRYHNVYGPRMGDKHFLPDFIERSRKGEFSIWGGEETRTFLHVRDAVDMTIRLAFHSESENGIFNIGGDKEVRIEEIAKLVLKIMKIEAEILCMPRKSGSVLRRAPNMVKTNALLANNTKKISLSDGIKEMVLELAADE